MTDAPSAAVEFPEIFPSGELLARAEKGELEAVCRLDASGFLVRPGESALEFVSRVRGVGERLGHTEELLKTEGTFQPYPGIVVRPEKRIPRKIISEAARITEEKYGFSLEWAPGFFPEQGLGPLWGGCAVCDDVPDALPVFIIRKEFEKNPRWFIYSRQELLSHEICHAARMPLRDRPLEEHFAYAISGSRLRRKIGNCFQTDWDAILFVLPVFVLLAAQIAINVFEVRCLNAVWFWVAAFVWPAFLLLRNYFQREMYFRAEAVLTKAGFTKPEAALFRCTSDEIFEIVRNGAGMLLDPEAELRFKVIARRFR